VSASRYKKLKINGRTLSEHRVVAERMLGRKLTSEEVVHHKNEDRFDNRPENLEVLSHQKHAEHHNQKHPLTKTCPECGAVFAPAPTKRARQITCSRTCFRARGSRLTTEQMRKQLPTLRLTRSQAESAQARVAAGETRRSLAEQFGVHVDTIVAAIAEDETARARRRP
jgi:hypothetical protein